MVMTYIPKPLDTGEIRLDQELQELIEQVSKNIHEVWAENRLADGWQYGVSYDGDRKLHPCLIPYDQLTEREKDLDRATVKQTVKTLLKLGYEIKKGGPR